MAKPTQGFTLIEILVVISLLGVFTAVAAGTFTDIMRASNKVRAVSELERAGNYALGLMEQQLRDASQIVFPREGTGTDCVIYQQGGERKGFRRIAISDISTLQQGSSCTASPTAGCDCTNWENLLNQDAEKGVDVVALGFRFTSPRVTISLELAPSPNAPARQDFQSSPVSLETTVVVRRLAY